MSIYKWLSRAVRRTPRESHRDGDERTVGCQTPPRASTQSCELLLGALRRERIKKHWLEVRLLESERQLDAARRDLEQSHVLNGELIEALAELQQRLQAINCREFSDN